MLSPVSPQPSLPMVPNGLFGDWGWSHSHFWGPGLFLRSWFIFKKWRSAKRGELSYLTNWCPEHINTSTAVSAHIILIWRLYQKPTFEAVGDEGPYSNYLPVPLPLDWGEVLMAKHVLHEFPLMEVVGTLLGQVSCRLSVSQGMRGAEVMDKVSKNAFPKLSSKRQEWTRIGTVAAWRSVDMRWDRWAHRKWWEDLANGQVELEDTTEEIEVGKDGEICRCRLGGISLV